MPSREFRVLRAEIEVMSFTQQALRRRQFSFHKGPVKNQLGTKQSNVSGGATTVLKASPRMLDSDESKSHA